MGAPESVAWRGVRRAGGLLISSELRQPIGLSYCSFAYSAFASFRIGMSGSASFQRVRKPL